MKIEREQFNTPLSKKLKRGLKLYCAMNGKKINETLEGLLEKKLEEEGILKMIK